MMAGTLQLSRALADRQLADEVLEQGIHNALALLGIEHEHANGALIARAPVTPVWSGEPGQTQRA
jgi:hypothetical protein